MDNKESILNKINILVDKYNNASGNDKIKIVSDKVIDTENLYICLYDDDKVGLFKKTNYRNEIVPNYNYLDIYCGVDTNNVAIYLSTILTSREKWCNNGEKIQVDGKDYFATCKINSAYNLESFKLMMYHEGIINDSNINMILSSEISKLIDSAYYYFNVSWEQKALKERKIEAAYRYKRGLMKSKRGIAYYKKELENYKKELKDFKGILGEGEIHIR